MPVVGLDGPCRHHLTIAYAIFDKDERCGQVLSTNLGVQGPLSKPPSFQLTHSVTGARTAHSSAAAATLPPHKNSGTLLTVTSLSAGLGATQPRTETTRRKGPHDERMVAKRTPMGRLPVAISHLPGHSGAKHFLPPSIVSCSRSPVIFRA